MLSRLDFCLLVLLVPDDWPLDLAKTLPRIFKNTRSPPWKPIRPQSHHNKNLVTEGPRRIGIDFASVTRLLERPRKTTAIYWKVLIKIASITLETSILSSTLQSYEEEAMISTLSPTLQSSREDTMIPILIDSSILERLTTVQAKIVGL